MAHARKQIRDAVISALGGLAATGDRVTAGRARPAGAADLASLGVWTPAETSSRAVAGNPPILERPLTLYVEGRVSKAGAPDDDLDEIAEQVEAKLGLDITIGGKVFHLQMVGTQTVITAEGDVQVGGVRLEYRMTYRTREGAPGTIV